MNTYSEVCTLLLPKMDQLSTSEIRSLIKVLEDEFILRREAAARKARIMINVGSRVKVDIKDPRVEGKEFTLVRKMHKTAIVDLSGIKMKVPLGSLILVS